MYEIEGKRVKTYKNEPFYWLLREEGTDFRPKNRFFLDRKSVV